MKKLHRIGMAMFLGTAIIFTACKVKEPETDTMTIDNECFDALCGDYQAQEQSDDENCYVGGWWHLYIGDGEDGKAYLSIYDNSAGNPGVEGEITSLDNETITIEINEEYYDGLPASSWEDDGDSLKLYYEINDKGIELTNNDFTVMFINEDLPKVICAHWKAEDSDELTSINWDNEHINLEGWYRDEDGNWDNTPTSYFMASDCIFVDNFLGNGEISSKEFQEILECDDINYSVIELVLEDFEIIEVRLVEPDASQLAE